MPGPDFQRVANLPDLPAGEMTSVDLDGEKVLVANVDGEICAVADLCPHADALLSDGYLDDNLVECPLHASVFDLTSGAVLEGPASDDIEKYQVAVEGDDIYVGPPVD